MSGYGGDRRESGDQSASRGRGRGRRHPRSPATVFSASWRRAGRCRGWPGGWSAIRACRSWQRSAVFPPSARLRCRSAARGLVARVGGPRTFARHGTACRDSLSDRFPSDLDGESTLPEAGTERPTLSSFDAGRGLVACCSTISGWRASPRLSALPMSAWSLWRSASVSAARRSLNRHLGGLSRPSHVPVSGAACQRRTVRFGTLHG